VMILGWGRKNAENIRRRTINEAQMVSWGCGARFMEKKGNGVAGGNSDKKKNKLGKASGRGEGSTPF